MYIRIFHVSNKHSEIAYRNSLDEMRKHVHLPSLIAFKPKFYFALKTNSVFKHLSNKSLI